MDLIPSKQLSCEIKEFIEDYDKLLILGIGNILRGDDGLGSLFIDVVYDKLTKTTKNTDNIFLLNAEAAPENQMTTIRQINPSHIIIVDAVEFDTTPGEIVLINKEQIDEFSFSTHSMPISFLINYIETTIGSKSMIIGIQPESMTLVNTISDVVDESVGELAEMIVETI